MLDRLGLAGRGRAVGLPRDPPGPALDARRVARSTADVAGPDGLPGIGLSRSFLDDLIVRRAREAGAEVFEGTRVGGAIVEAGRVVGRPRPGRRGLCEVRARVTIAADGRHSALVKQTGRTRGRSWSRPRLFGLKRHFAVDDPDAAEQAGTVGLHLVPGGYGGTCRIEGGSTNLCALLPESAVRSRRGDLDRVAAECLGRNPVLARLLERRASRSASGRRSPGVRVQVSTPDRARHPLRGRLPGDGRPAGRAGDDDGLAGRRDAGAVRRAGPGLGRGRRPRAPGRRARPPGVAGSTAG